MASRGLTALLGLLAVAGYQNRHRLSEMFGQLTARKQPGGDSARDSMPGGVLGGLGELLERFKGKDEKEIAKSWVGAGPNRDIEVSQLEQSLGDDTIEALMQQTGLSREELLTRLQTVLPNAVDKLTPNGELPREGA